MNSLFRFCPSCGKPLETKSKKLIECGSCGFNFYFSPASTNALILVNEKGEILLTKRKFEPKKGYWDLPGGFVELGETVEQSLIREIKEELGLELGKTEYIGSYVSIYPFKGIDYQTLCHAFTTKYRGGKIKVGDDVSEYKFFPKEKIPYDKLSFDDIESALKDYSH
jgi:mutator protein MutT